MSRQIHIWNFKSICQKMTKKSPENESLAKGNNSCKSRSNVTKAELDLYYVKRNSYMKFQVNMSKDDKEKSGKRFFLQRAITNVKVGQMRPKSNLTCIMSRQIHIWNFNSIYQKMTKKSPENEIFAKGNNSCKTMSSTTKVKLDLYNIKTNPYTKFQVNISKDDWEKFGKPSGRTPSGLTDWRTDGRTDRQTDRRTDGQTDTQTVRKPIVPQFGKPSGRTPSGLTDWRTDGQTDRQTDWRTDRHTDGEETYSPPVSPVGD